ncbi:MAG: indolepyruvate oxidoreductase subunit beta [Candidatus Heimdallarchaeota archaeon]|nr:indolepyruvate oxidoreductase subunit beta [Candidatus Heimdallarchaeota archaeon]MCG3255901.1 indolepyruvate oxidoreductase subunit beta [Candidatus Heimdallarchaeota archaeon]MCK4610972.1 indolepyruvate oxidoreductase subunit beta [Candidatus Heimdallarchaeota archaeon]
MSKTYKMIVCGVGGQGILTITDIIVIAARKKGLHVLGSEVHGMAQKGGSVVTNLKIGEKLHSPTNPIGTCEVLVGLEQNESLRYMKFLKPRGIAITSNTVLFPISWKKDKKAADNAKEKIEENITKFDVKLVMIKAENLAIEAGLALTQNIVLLGALSQVEEFPLTEDELRDALKQRVPAKYVEQNLKAFELGIKTVKNL